MFSLAPLGNILEVHIRSLCKYSHHTQTSTQKWEQTQIKVLSVPRPRIPESTGEMYSLLCSCIVYLGVEETSKKSLLPAGKDGTTSFLEAKEEF